MKGAATMNKYIVKDWAGNTMNWGEYSDFDYASEAITYHVLDKMSSEGIDSRWTEDREDGTEFDENMFYQWCEEYYIDEIEGE